MKLSPKARLALWCAPGAILQLAGLWWAIRAGWEEVNLLVGVTLFCVGTPLTMLPIERHLARISRRDTWALTALLGPIGPLIAGTLGRGEHQSKTPGAPQPSRADRLIGLCLTVLISVGLLLAAWQWTQLRHEPTAPDPARMKANEQQAYERLKAIAAAQEQYRQRDWDGDGRKTYAAFQIHLWRSVDPRGTPIDVELIPRELGFAMVGEFALDGYMYESLHVRALLRDAEGGPASAKLAGMRELDPGQEWAVVAKPATPLHSGWLDLLADSTGAIWATQARGAGKVPYPSDPAQAGWTEVRSAQHLAEIQAAMDYSPTPRTPRK